MQNAFLSLRISKSVGLFVLITHAHRYELTLHVFLGAGGCFTPSELTFSGSCPAPSSCRCCLSGSGWWSWSAASSCECCCPSPPCSRRSACSSRRSSARNPAGGGRWRSCISTGCSSCWGWRGAQTESPLCSQNLQNRQRGREGVINPWNIWDMEKSPCKWSSSGATWRGV